MKKNFFIFSFLIVFVICGSANTGAQAHTAIKPPQKTNLTGYWYFVSPTMIGKVSVLEIQHRREKKFKLRILGSSSMIDSEWDGFINGDDVSFSGGFQDGGGPRPTVKFDGQLISAYFIKGNLTMQDLTPNTANPSVKVLMVRAGQTFTEKYWGFVNREGQKLVVGIVKDDSGDFIFGGFSGWPYGGGGRNNCSFLQCGGQIYDYVKEGGKIILKTDAVSSGEGVALLCFSPGRPGTGHYTISGCSAQSSGGTFKVYGPYAKAENIPFLSLKKGNFKKAEKVKIHKRK